MIPVMKKLKSKSGISLAIALVFFLLCAMVGTVVLSAASVSAGNTARERQFYRETLAMTSAAQLLRQEIQSMSFQGKYIKTETVTTIVPPEGSGGKTTVKTEKEWTEDGTSSLVSGELNLFSGDDFNLKPIFPSSQEPPPGWVPLIQEEVKQKLTFQPIPEKNIPEVTGELSVSTDYTTTVVLWCGKNSMTLIFPAQTAEETAIETPNPEVTGNTSVKKTITTYTTTITWGAPTVQEGVDAP